jgi:predicted kinase
MTKKTPGVAFYGKVRIPTIGHKTAIDQAKGIAKKVGGKLTVGLSGASEPLDIKTKRAHAQKVFDHPVETGEDHTKSLSSFLTHLHKKHDHLHLVAGSDRVEEYRSFISKYNGKKDKKGNVPFHFKKVEVHAAGGERRESNKDPRKMSRDELVSSVSASKLEKLAKEGKYDHFKAYHPDMPEGHVRKVYTQIRKHHALNEGVNIGLTFARSEMPQLGASKSFIKYLQDNNIVAVRRKIDPKELKSSQMEFDDDKVMGLRFDPSSNPIVVSNDGHVLDGHHRWLADQEEGRSCDAYVCNLPILDLMHHAKRFTSLNEEVTRKELAPMLDSFVSFASDKLGIKSMPKVRYKSDEDDYNSFAAYNPADNELSVHTKGRHPMDVFRSVAHELVHHKQNEEGRIGKNIAKEGSTGSKIENEANAEAGKIMRWFAQTNPDYFSKSHIVEETIEEGINDPGKLKAVFLAGGPGSGKDFVMKSVLDGNGLREINSDNAFEFLMNREGLDLQMPDHERLERDIVRGTAQNMTKTKQRLSLAGRLGLIINGTASDVDQTAQLKKMLERLGYETMMVFVNTSDEVSRQRNVQRGKDGKRKVPDGTDREGYPDNSPNIRKDKWDAAQKNLGKFQELFGMDKFTVIDNTADQRKLEPEEKEKVLASFHNVRRMVHNFVQTPNANQHAHNWINREADKRGITDYQPPRAAKTLTQFRQTATLPRSEPIDNSLMAQARRLGLSYYGFGRFGRKMNGKNTTMYKEKDGRLQRIIKEDMNQLFEKFAGNPNDPANREEGTKSVVEISKDMTPGSRKKMKKVVAQEDRPILPTDSLPVADGVGPTLGIHHSLGTLGIATRLSESIAAWVNNPKTQAKFISKYGDLAEQKLEEAALRLEACGCGKSADKMKKSVKSLRESEAWTRKEGQNPDGGLNKKGVESYRAANPGSKLSTAVTTEPSKLKKGSKSANRRKSFCARMGGMKKRLTSAKTANDPDSRINKSLRKWNCEE